MCRRWMLPVLMAMAVLIVALPAGASAASSDERMLDAINHARAAHRLAPLTPAATLSRASGNYAQDLVQRHRFQHASRIGARGFDRVGEVLARSPRPEMSPRSIVGAWLRSPMHRRVLLRPSYRYVGIGHSTGRRSAIWVVRLGTPNPGSPLPLTLPLPL